MISHHVYTALALAQKQAQIRTTPSVNGSCADEDKFGSYWSSGR